jgi:membrane fusion protein (multidrug efflux system)
VREGDLLVELDTRQERAQLRAAEARRELARANLDRSRSLLEQRIVSQSEFDAADAEFKRAEADAGEIRAAIARKTIRAPFSGTLGIRQINPGQYIAAGGPIVSLQALSPIYVNFAVPQQHVATLRRGTEVRVQADERAPIVGRVTAIDSVVDPATRNVQVQATVDNRAATLKPGMFVQATATVGDSDPVIAIPRSAISYAPYGDSVFVIGDLKNPQGKAYRGVRQRFVKLGPARGDQVAVVSGLRPGEEVVTSGVFKLRNNAAIQINNTVQPSNDAAPDVEDR